jgi:type IV pilus secretin PilQ/predicted competence protein
MKQKTCTGRLSLLSALLSAAVVIALSLTAAAQTDSVGQSADATVKVELSGAPAPVSDYVSIHVDGGTLRQVLNAFSMQTQRNVVIGPEVVSEGVSIHLNNVRWDEALDVILKPYGFGYRKVGDTVVVSKLEKLADLAAVELLETKVFNLKYLDAGDVQDIIKAQLSPRGTISIVAARGQKGWSFASAADNRSSSSGGTFGKLARQADPNQVKSKTLIITDVPGSLARVAEVLAEVDQMPQQVLVEARFMEVDNSLLKDIGMDAVYNNGNENEYSIGQLFSGVAPGQFDAATAAFWPATLNPNAFAVIDGSSFDVAIRALQEDQDTKVLSAPRVLTMNNQEATIIVGQKYPIIESNVSGGSGDNNTSTTLDYYENIGIQLNVVPQICADGFINMIVHPSVSSIKEFKSGTVSSGSSSNGVSLTEYPVINTRETETQIMLKNGEIVVIGGLLEDRISKTESKVPFLGDIPLLGRLFRRDIDNNQTINLLIFLSATIVDEKNYDTIIAKEGQAEMPGKPEAKAESQTESPDKPAALPEDIPPAAVITEPAAEVPVAEIVAELEASAPKTNP